MNYSIDWDGPGERDRDPVPPPTAHELAIALAFVLPLAGAFCFPQPGAATPQAIEDFNGATAVLARATRSGLLHEALNAQRHTCERCGENHYDHTRPTVPTCPFKPQRAPAGGGDPSHMISPTEMARRMGRLRRARMPDAEENDADAGDGARQKKPVRYE